MTGVFYAIFQKRVRVFHRGFKHEKTDNCCAVTIFEYSTSEFTLPIAVCQFRGNTLLGKANGRVQI